MCDEGFIKATGSNLPAIDIFMVSEFLKTDDRFNAAEVRGAKASRVSRESYGDIAIGYVQLKRDCDVCTVKCRVSPEHKVRSTAYVAIVKVNEKKNEVQEAQCLDCTAAMGGCKHALAFLMWLHRRSEDPAPTEIECYWKKSRLSGVGTTIKYIQAKDLGNKNRTSSSIQLPDNSTFLKKILQMAEENQIDSQISRLFFELVNQKPNDLSLHRLALKFHLHGSRSQSVDAFLSFCLNEMTKNLCDEVQRITNKQSGCPLWYNLGYGRITASKLYEMAHCKTENGSLINQVIGISKAHETKAMHRGKELEGDVLDEVSRLLRTNIQKTGLFLLPEFPHVGASPDGLTEEYIVEIKCPSNEESVQRFIANGVISPKCVAQMQLQMLSTGRKKGLFCVADPSFETNKRVSIYWITHDTAMTKDLINKATLFWSNNIFPKILLSVHK